ncbi:DUF1127 domain-containing protein [Caldimonas sp. KR1-144]|uniref:DUF1127 domain-containing protein n=1 Tax=Caldimonas sp. KR1-144 TaxID=3400911 RepID=UPI003C096D10
MNTLASRAPSAAPWPDLLASLAHRIARRLDRFAAERRERFAAEALSVLSDRELRDIGLRRADLPHPGISAWMGDDGAAPWAGRALRPDRF